jgi:hypothetical protein
MKTESDVKEVIVVKRDVSPPLSTIHNSKTHPTNIQNPNHPKTPKGRMVEKQQE